MQLQRISEQPVLVPRAHIPWECDAVFNTAVIYADSLVHLLYRGVAHPGWQRISVGQRAGRYDSCIGYAVSHDGLHFTADETPVMTCHTEMNGFWIHDPEDPRVTCIDGVYYMTYCNWGEGLTQMCLARSTDLRQWTNLGPIVPYERFGMNKNTALFPERIDGRYVMIHRPEPPQCRHLDAPLDWDIWSRDPKYPGGMRLAYSDDLMHWTYEDEMLMGPRAGCWDDLKVGIAGPPMKTEDGWVVIYHGVDQDHVYRLGVAVLDLNDPSLVLYRQWDPILSPELPWECQGDVPNVVFSCGSFIKDDRVWVYYCGADTVIGAATGDVRQLLAAMPHAEHVASVQTLRSL